MNQTARKAAIRNRALSLGFEACGFAKAEPLHVEARRLEEWLLERRHGDMGWMERNFDKRIDPSKLVPGTRTIISVIGSYNFPANDGSEPSPPSLKIASYARGRDYHKVFKKRLRTLFAFLKESVGDVNGRIFVDSAPVMDKVWAERAGLGWIGKNSNLLNRSFGSFFLIGEILVDLDLEPDKRATDHCGSCTRCIDACPTDAIYEPYRVDGSRCISYLTIELKNQIPEEYRNRIGNWIFGCDICQDVCPWNRKAIVGTIEELEPREEILNAQADFDLLKELTFEEYERLFNGTPVRRARFPKLKQSIATAIQNQSGSEEN